MNIYNTLYFLEYSKDPIRSYYYKDWYMNLSKQKFHYRHREFDLVAIYGYCYNMKGWYKYEKYYRLIGPTIIDINGCKSYYINNELINMIS